MPFPRPTLTDLRQQAQQDVLNAGIPGIDALLTFSVLSVVTWVQAMFAWLHYGYLDWIALQAVPSTATDEYLAQWGNLKNVPQKSAAAAACPTVTFAASAGAAIPVGTQIARSDNWIYVTTAASTLSGGVITVPVASLATGAAGNAAQGTTVALASPVPGVQTSGILNAAATGGADIESQADYRARVIQAYQAIGSNGAGSEYVEWAEAVPGVTRAWVLGRGAGAGTVVVYVMLDQAEIAFNGFPQGTNGAAAAETRTAPATGDQLAVANAIYPLQPVTALVIVCAPNPLAVDFSIVTPTALSSALSAGIRQALVDLFVRQGSPLGATLFPSDWLEAVASVAGIGQFQITAPSAPITFAVGQIPTLGALISTVSPSP